MKAIVSIARGKSRIVILIPFLNIAIKFARTSVFRFIWMFARDWQKYSLDTAIATAKYHWKFVAINGLRENIQERLLYARTKNPLLVPTYLSFGFVNAQKFQEGRMPKGYQWFQQVILFTEAHNWVSSHSFGNHDNWRIDESGKLLLVDYGARVIAPVIERFGGALYEGFDERRVITSEDQARITDFQERWYASRARIAKVFSPAPSR
jgi:hypothetical protein